MKKYFLHNGADQQGPFDIEDLKAKNITRETPIWFDGISEWTTAGKVDNLKLLFVTIPPPFSITNSTPPPIQKTEPKQAETYSQPEKKKSKLGKYALILGGLLALGGGGLFIANQNNLYNGGSYETPIETYQEKVMTVEEIENSQPANFLTADGNYNENFWGDKLKVHGTITNKATVATYKDAVVRITYYSKTKTELGNKEYTIYETFPPNSTTNFELKIENYKDVNSIGWDVINATTN
jgi:hypothetical protein